MLALRASASCSAVHDTTFCMGAPGADTRRMSLPCKQPGQAYVV